MKKLGQFLRVFPRRPPQMARIRDADGRKSRYEEQGRLLVFEIEAIEGTLGLHSLVGETGQVGIPGMPFHVPL
jgi:hypothetical protein